MKLCSQTKPKKKEVPFILGHVYKLKTDTAFKNELYIAVYINYTKYAINLASGHWRLFNFETKNTTCQWEDVTHKVCLKVEK